MGSSSQKAAIMTSIQTYNLLSNRSAVTKIESNAIGPPISSAILYRAEVNTLLAGSMMFSLTLLVVCMCFLLHRKFKTSSGSIALHSFPWAEDLEVYTLSGQEEITGIYMPPTPSPPPAYDTVVTVDKKEDEEDLKKPGASYNPDNKVLVEDDGLPTYEAAIKLRVDSYI